MFVIRLVLVFEPGGGFSAIVVNILTGEYLKEGKAETRKKRVGFVLPLSLVFCVQVWNFCLIIAIIPPAMSTIPATPSSTYSVG